MKKILVLLPIVLLLTACGSFLPIKEVSPQSFSLPIYKKGDTYPKVSEYLNIVVGHSCKNKLWDKEPSKDDAIKQLKNNAYLLDAESVVEVVFNTRNTSLATNCWSSIKATGQAVKFK